MIIDAYRTLNKQVKIDEEDQISMVETLDHDKDGRVNSYDLEKLVDKILNANRM